MSGANETRTDEAAEVPGTRRWPVTPFDLLKVLAGLAAVAGLMLHLIGTVWNETRLATWGVDAALFPKATDWLVIRGYEQSVGLALAVLPQMLANALWLTLLAVGISLYWGGLSWLTRKLDNSNNAPRWFNNGPKWFQLAIARFIVVASLMVATPLVVWLAGKCLAVPLAVAEILARSDAKAEMMDFQKGCDATAFNRCFLLKRGTEMIGQGLLITSSTENIAFFDVNAKQVRVVPRVGTEMAMALPKP